MASIDTQELERIQNEAFTPKVLALLLMTESNDGHVPPPTDMPWAVNAHRIFIHLLAMENMIDADTHMITQRGQTYCDALLQLELPSAIL